MKECPKCQSCFDDMQNYCTSDNTVLLPSIAGSNVISGRYILEKRLGIGGMGIVYKARHKFLKSFYAVKLILPSLAGTDPALLRRFNQEAILAASIDHPNVIRVTDFGIENETLPFLVMEYVDGISLMFHLSANKNFTPAKALEIFKPVASGIAEAHRKEIVHRDLKPQNIMLQHDLPLEKAVKVLDFGLAKIKSTDTSVSIAQAETLNTIGSPNYMSPEQWENGDIDHRTDIYSLGIILFQLLTGRSPFQGESLPQIMFQHLSAAPPSFASLGVQTSAEIEAVVRKALQKAPEARFAAAGEMLDAFEKAVADLEKFSLQTNPEFDFYKNPPPPLPIINKSSFESVPENQSVSTVDVKREQFEINLNSDSGSENDSAEKITVLAKKDSVAAQNLFSLKTFISGAAIFLIVSAGIYGVYRYRAVNIESEIASNPVVPASKMSPPLPEIMNRMVLLDGGSFQMGRDDVPPQDIVWGNQYPAHSAQVNSFYLAKSEVSNEDYARFIAATGHRSPESWSGGKFPGGQSKYPVTFVSLADAKAYAEWFSKESGKSCRLPTEIEWEYAARNGSRQTSFPWGNDWKPDFANIATNNLSSVGSTADKTEIGEIEDMLGSVIEWTSSNYALYPAHPGKLESQGTDFYIVRGSSFGESQNRLKNAEWILTRRQAVSPDQKSQYLGFRIMCLP